MRFFNIDCHISVISDVKHIFNNLNHTVDDWSVSGHAGVVNKKKHEIKLNSGYIINECNHITREIGKDFYETFKDTFDKYDGFICCYPVEFCILYELFNKPIIIVNCIRYEHPFTRFQNNWNELNDVIKSLNEKGLLHWICNNKGDCEYIKYYMKIIQSNINYTWIHSLCEYTNVKYNPVHDKYLISNRTPLSSQHLNNMAIPITSIPKQTQYFSWSDKAKFKGVVHIPYHNGSMSIFEEYISNIPLFFPSKTFGKTLFNTPNKIMFNDLTFYRYYNRKEPDELDNPNSLRNENNLNMWFDTCDFYDSDNMPFIYYFDSLQHLNHMLSTLTIEELVETSKKMSEFNKKRQKIVYEKWNNILLNISST